MFAKELTERLQREKEANQSTDETVDRRKSRNVPDFLSPNNEIFNETPYSSNQVLTSKSKKILNSEPGIASVYSRSSKRKEETNKKKSLTVEEANGWKCEVDIDSILGSETTSKFDKLIDEYHNIQDSGIKFTPTVSSRTFDSAKRRLKFNEIENKSPAKWAKDKYIKAVCRLQNSYLKNN